MKSKIIEQQINNSINDFFDNNWDLEENKISVASDVQLKINRNELDITEKADRFVKALKTVFIFLPGAFFLYFTSIFFLYTFFVDKTSLADLSFGLILWTVSALMTVFGMGDIRNFKSFAIPSSIYAISFTLFLISMLLPHSTQVTFLFEYSAFLFPLALIFPYLTNNFIKNATDKNLPGE